MTPRGTDPQKPHTRDEVYVVVTGRGDFFNGDARERFEPGDVLFVPAHVEHRFESFSGDLVVWVMFYGPEGRRGDDGSCSLTEPALGQARRVQEALDATGVVCEV